MSFCKFSSQFVINSSTTIDNTFLNEYLPNAPDSCVKVFLYGLYKCSNADSRDNTLESFAKVLSLTEEDIESAYLYWQEQGLVQVLNTNPIEVRYLPIKASLGKARKFKKEKYASFNLQVQDLIEGRMITPTEYQEYYTLIESLKVEPEALIMIIKYATDIKGKNVGYKYITTVAKNWIYEGIKTTKDVEEKLIEHEQNSGSILEVLKSLGLRRSASFEERQLYIKWTKELGFLKDTILNVAKSLKRKGGFLRLDNKLTKYYELKRLSFAEIEAYEKEKDNMYTLARTITKSIGVYYQDLSNVVETYVSDWLNKGFSNETLEIIANYCFKNNVRTLEGMNNTVLKFYKLGIVTLESLNQYIGEIVNTDKQIKQILEACGLVRNVTSWDRDYFRTWTYSWNLSLEVILYACELSYGKTNPVKYLNKILASWHEGKVDTLEKAKEFKGTTASSNVSTANKNLQTHSYSSEELNALFDNLDEVDI